ncbi:CDP-glycerol glycerophosphotransferase family protein [Pediococcus pentosaceus]|uniref:CDP-glycerol glycerophosphotransferase family protein n=1 Tax=Pediococcus pentosaceus TaxID=1255 RepID=A0AB73HGY9_PEDPE|nr:CDP-glycerol glycerophosphotransferase family protein [Pediococcus pentosaceus]MBF7115290.1 CDP-glycerol glycerophosphotransferase family protein [Pediococcus pentosaceus]MCM6792805.1 CDP-glycerol glycerophosphotransferase family protein [Pediococcus pentosaceus]MCM6810104.1 CDP-glycerol glycerophosphotransferase family protein [Pediococcus pentosaceus]MDN3207219.1 CDP-glycerol glycerophosphotransferase family protein [Pediococcus pentosaceus]
MKKIYLLLVRLARLAFGAKKAQYQVAYFMSFAGNETFIRELVKQFGSDEVLIVYKTNVKENVLQLQQGHIIKHAIEFKKFQVTSFVKGIKLARVTLFDNYYPELSAINKTKKDYFIQMWHANGAIKAFGWEDPSTYHRLVEDQQRFQRVYDSFDQIVVGSEKMADVFQRSWHVASDKIDRIGYPRTDKYFEESWIEKARKKIQTKLPELTQKRVILYAPTYRKDVSFSLPDDWRKIKVPQDTVLIVRLHPHLANVERQIVDASPDRVIMVDHFISTQELLCVADTLITDYSSIAFDFSLLDNARSVIFFTYDLEEFERTVGIQVSFKAAFLNQMVNTVEQLNDAILFGNSDKNVIHKLNQQWNTLNDGHSSARLIKQVKERCTDE